MELLAFIFLFWLIGCMFPGSGGSGPDGAGIVAGILAGIIGLAIIGGILYGAGWTIYQAWFFVLGEPTPGSNMAAGFLLVMMFGPILGLFAVAKLGGFLENKFRARPVRDQP